MSDIIPSSPISTIESVKVTMESSSSSATILDPTKKDTTHKIPPHNHGNNVDDDTTTVTTVPPKGVAGRINYAQWDKVTKDLVTQIDEESQQEKIEEGKKVRFYGI